MLRKTRSPSPPRGQSGLSPIFRPAHSAPQLLFWVPFVNSWSLVAVVVGATVLGDLLQSIEMKRHGEIQNFHPRWLPKLFATLARKKFLILGIFFMAISFFAFITLLETADLSFAVPVSAASIVLETILARIVLKERVDARRWAGALLVLGGVLLLAQ